jgi:hypothetical protein
MPAKTGLEVQLLRHAAALKEEISDLKIRAEIAERELNLAYNELHNAGEGYCDSGESIRLYLGIKNLSRRAHDAERELAVRDIDVK